MTDARREPVTREEYAIARGRGYYDQLEDAYFALANRLAGVERVRDEYYQQFLDAEDRAEALQQRLAEVERGVWKEAARLVGGYADVCSPGVMCERKSCLRVMEAQLEAQAGKEA